MRTLLKRMVQKVVGHTEEPLDRVVMNQTTREWIDALPTNQMDAFEISGCFWKNRVKKPWKSYTEGWYPEFDICSPIGKTDQYDIIISEQVFEHLPYPWRAIKNVYSLLRPGGYFLTTTPFLNKIHASPIDCTRWTPQGLFFLLEEGGFSHDAIRTASWGNRQAVRLFLRWRNYCSRLHSLKNEPDYPLCVWALARK